MIYCNLEPNLKCNINIKNVNIINVKKKKNIFGIGLKFIFI